MRALWKAVNANNKGFCTLDDLDPLAAQVVAEFKVFLKCVHDAH